jgi:hypothetical protein
VAFSGYSSSLIFLYWKGLLGAESAAADASIVGVIVTLTMPLDTKA